MTKVPTEPLRHQGRGLIKHLFALFAGLAVALTLVMSIAPAEAASSTVTWTQAKVVRWVDGDTVVTNHGRVRLIGVDTPEKGRCGAVTATKWAKRWAPVGSTVKLGNPKSVKNKDRYGRNLRYVVRGKVDVSKSQIVKGARARYDSTDGYQWHPRQTGYHKADRAHRNYHCALKTRLSHPTSTAPISKWDCPSWAPIKGNQPSMIYHMPRDRYYDATTPERCFSTQSAAQAAGYRAAKV